jgi:hypothetical protein
MRRLLPVLFLLAGVVPAHAIDFEFEGYGDFRLVLPGDQRSWLDGGLGKLRYGRGDSNFQFAGAVGQGTVLLTPELMAVAVVRVAPTEQQFVAPLEAYLRYRPVSTSRWRWSIKAGAFFAPLSLENNEVGWSSYWTITPSAINSWFGDELRTIGSEGKLEWRTDDGTLALIGAVYGWNDPAGVMLADRGWAMDDRPTGFFDKLRDPDETVTLLGGTPPEDTPIFKEIDSQPGWYAGASWEDTDQWHAEIFRYDNEQNPAARSDGTFAWYTSFWDAGLSKKFGDFTALAQGVTGQTTIAPAPGFSSVTQFNSAYALLGWEKGDWRLAARAETFDTIGYFGEHGHAFTAAVSWLPKDWLRITAELISLDSTRSERALEGLNPNELENLAQLSVRIYF